MFLRSSVSGIDRARAKIRSIGPIVRKTSRQLLTQEARLIAISLAKSSQPFGTGADARRAGLFRTLSDIYQVYATPGHAYSDIGSQKAAKAFWWAIKNGKADKAQGILRWGGNLLRNVPIGNFDDGALHKQNRDPHTGRVRVKTAKLIVTDPSRVATYVAERQSHVGFGKSGWVTVARLLVSSGAIRGLKTSGDITANWITRQSGPGTVVWSGTDENLHVTLTSKVRYASQILPERDKRIAISIAQSRLRKSLLTAIRAEMRNARLAA
jgi:hypothetical protein